MQFGLPIIRIKIIQEMRYSIFSGKIYFFYLSFGSIKTLRQVKLFK
jgi:hypothetical protein